MRQIVILLLLLVFKISALKWSPPCPHECWCHEAPMSSIANSAISVQTVAEKSRKNSSNLTDAEDVRTVFCIQQHDTDIDTLFARLPIQTEAIRIIQAPDAPHIRLHSAHFRSFGTNLRALSLEGSVSNGSMRLYSDSFLTTSELQYLNLQNLELTDDPSDNESITPARSTITEITDDQNNGALTNLTYQLPEEEPYEILPYEEYKTMKMDNIPMDGTGLWDGFAKLTKLEYLTISGCTLPDGLVYGHSGAFSSLVQLKNLIIRSSNLRMRPAISRGDLRQLQFMSLADNKILELQKEDLEGLDRLRSFDLTGNNLTKLTENSFPYLGGLETIDLSGNPLEAVYPLAFHQLNATRSLVIGTWNWKDDHPVLDGRMTTIHPGSFEGLDQLEELRMGPVTTANNKGLNPDHLRGTQSLQELHIRGAVHSVETDTFLLNNRMQWLDLKNCSIRSLSLDAFQGLYKLRILDLSDNTLVQLLPGLFDPLVSLKELWLTGNQLTTLPTNIFKYWTKMVRLEGNPWHCTCQLDQLRPTSVNKIKRIDPLSNRTEYAYERKVTPLCQSPAAVKGLAVFDVIRKELRCKKMKKIAPPSFRILARRALADSLLVPMSYDVIDHGPEINETVFREENEDTNNRNISQKDLFDDVDIIDHGPEIVLDQVVVMIPSTKLKSAENDVLVESNNKEESELKSATVHKSEFYSPTLSKKSLKLLMDEEKNKKRKPIKS